MNPLFDRRSRERVERVGAALSESAADWRRAPPRELRARILAAIDAHARAPRSSSRPRVTWPALAAALLIAWLAWHAFVPPRVSPARALANSPAQEFVRRAWAGLPAPALARAFDRPLVAEVGHVRSDVSRAFEFLVERITIPLTTRGSR